MNRDIIKLANGASITVDYSTRSSAEEQMARQYFEQNGGKWAHKVPDLAEKAGMKTKKFKDLVFSSVEVWWHDGQCQHAGQPGCQNEVKLRVLSRTQLTDILNDKKPLGPEYRNKESWNPEIEEGWWKYDPSGEGLCDFCFGEELYRSRKKQEEEKRLSNEHRRLMQEQKEVQRLENIDRIKNRLASERYYSSGFKGLDRILSGGFKEGFLHVLSSHPEAEAYSYLLTLINHFNDLNVKGLFISFTVNEREIYRQLASEKSNITYEKLNDPDRLSDEQAEIVSRSLDYDQSVRVVYAAKRNMKSLENLIDNAIAAGEKLIIIDCLQDMLIDPEDRIYAANKEQEFTSNIMRLNEFIGQKKITVIARALMNRDIVQRGLKQPRLVLPVPVLSDLRDSNVLERYAYNVLFLHRPSFYGDKRTKGAHIHVAKRFGYQTNAGTCSVDFDEQSGFFRP